MTDHPSVVPGGIRVQWSGRPDERYRVVRSTNLAHSPILLDEHVSTNFFIDPSPPPTAFYGVELLGPPAP